MGPQWHVARGAWHVANGAGFADERDENVSIFRPAVNDAANGPLIMKRARLRQAPIRIPGSV